MRKCQLNYSIINIFSVQNKLCGGEESNLSKEKNLLEIKDLNNNKSNNNTSKNEKMNKIISEKNDNENQTNNNKKKILKQMDKISLIPVKIIYKKKKKKII